MKAQSDKCERSILLGDNTGHAAADHVSILLESGFQLDSLVWTHPNSNLRKTRVASVVPRDIHCIRRGLYSHKYCHYNSQDTEDRNRTYYLTVRHYRVQEALCRERTELLWTRQCTLREFTDQPETINFSISYLPQNLANTTYSSKKTDDVRQSTGMIN
jgi:hypothetical protein